MVDGDENLQKLLILEERGENLRNHQNGMDFFPCPKSRISVDPSIMAKKLIVACINTKPSNSQNPHLNMFKQSQTSDS